MTKFDVDSYADWRMFVGGKRDFQPKAVTPVILDSWKRSRNYGIDPFSSGFQSVSSEELHRRRTGKADLCKVATPYINNLYEVIKGSGSLIVLSDEDGVIIDLASDAASHAIRNFPEAGTIQSESVVGTNGIGTALAGRALVQIRGAEHWLLDNHSWICNAAPIITNNRVVGGLNLSTPSRRQNALSLGLVNSAVTAIARELELSTTLKEIQFLTQQQHAVLKLMENGVIFISRSGLVTQANERAHLILKDDGDWTGKHISEAIKSDVDFMEVFRSRAMFDAHEISLQLQRRYTHLHVSTELINIGESSETMAILLHESKKMMKIANKLTGSTAHFHFEDIIGNSPNLADCLSLAKQAAKNRASVLIMGESGTGKELIAQSIHNASERRDQPFIAVNCGAFSRELILSELFGYEGGAFTGAKADGNPGKFELADGGTIFLDEIGELPLESQVALLRVLQTNEVTRIGSAKTKSIDVRVIAATNKDLSDCIRDKSFREDLFFRINIFMIRLPSLRERRGDLRPLADAFLKRLRAHLGKPRLRFGEACYERLELYPWPGNIRQLENVVERAATMCAGNEIGIADLPAELAAVPSPLPAAAFPVPASCPDLPAFAAGTGLKAAGDYGCLEQIERDYLKGKLAEAGGNLRLLAANLNVSRSTVYRLVQRHGLDPDEYRPRPGTQAEAGAFAAGTAGPGFPAAAAL